MPNNADQTVEKETSLPSKEVRLQRRRRALRAARVVALAGMLATAVACGDRSVGSDAGQTDGGLADVQLSDTVQKKDTLDCSQGWEPGCPIIGPGVPPEMPS